MEEREEVLRDPQEYYTILQDMYLDESEIDISTDFEARASLVKIRRLKSDVLDLRRVINKDMRTIRNMYLDESMIQDSKILGLFSLKKLSPTQKRKKLINQREKNLTPYNEIIEMVDDYIKQIDELEKFIKNKALTYSHPKYTRVTKGD